MPETYWAHTRHSGHASARAKYAEYVPSMRLDDVGKNGTGWDVFEGFQSHLAMTRNEMLRGSAAQRIIVVSYRWSDYCVVQSGRFRPILDFANRAVEWSQVVP